MGLDSTWRAQVHVASPFEVPPTVTSYDQLVVLPARSRSGSNQPGEPLGRILALHAPLPGYTLTGWLGWRRINGFRPSAATSLVLCTGAAHPQPSRRQKGRATRLVFIPADESGLFDRYRLQVCWATGSSQPPAMGCTAGSSPPDAGRTMVRTGCPSAMDTRWRRTGGDSGSAGGGAGGQAGAPAGLQAPGETGGQRGRRPAFRPQGRPGRPPAAKPAGGLRRRRCRFRSAGSGRCRRGLLAAGAG